MSIPQIRNYSRFRDCIENGYIWLDYYVLSCCLSNFVNCLKSIQGRKIKRESIKYKEEIGEKRGKGKIKKIYIYKAVTSNLHHNLYK